MSDSQAKDAGSKQSMSVQERLRSLPSVTQILAASQLTGVGEEVGHDELRRLTQLSIAAARAGQLGATDGSESVELLDQCVSRVKQLFVAERRQSLGHVINATGVLLHTNLGRAPLADKARERMSRASGYCNVELDLQDGKRSPRGERTTQLLARLTGAEAALVVNNCAAATMLTLAALSRDRETIISRSQLVEIGGGFRLPEVFEASGAMLREVGTTNRTYARDYARALGEETGAILKVHRSNFSLDGFVAEPAIGELVELNASNDIAVVDDVGSGCLHDLSSLGLNEPNVIESVKAGADLVLFSGDKLFGGPQAGIVVGKQRWISQLSQHPMMRAMRVDKCTLAGLEATCEIHLAKRHPTEMPLYEMMVRTAEDVRMRCETLVARLSPSSAFDIRIVSQQSPIGGGTLPGFTLPSFALQIATRHPKDLSKLADLLRTGEPAVLGRVSDGHLLLDLRSVLDAEFEGLEDCLAEAFAGVSLLGEAL